MRRCLLLHRTYEQLASGLASLSHAAADRAILGQHHYNYDQRSPRTTRKRRPNLAGARMAAAARAARSPSSALMHGRPRSVSPPTRSVRLPGNRPENHLN